LLKLTDKELAFQFEVSEVTINAWKKAHPEFLKSIKRGKVEADSEVALSTFKSACGFEVDAVDIRTVSLGVQVGSKIIKTSYKKYYPPNVTAAIFWVKNRTRKNYEPWQDVHRTEHTGKDGKAIQVHKQVDLKDISTDQLMALRDVGIDLAEGANGNSRN
jgi:hypothetical protein